MARFKTFVKTVTQIIKGFSSRKMWTFAAATAFYLFLSLFPLVTLLCTLLPYTPLTQEGLLSLMDRFMPDYLYELLGDIVRDVYDSSAATLSVAAVASVWSASMSVQSIMRGLDVAYDRKRKTNYVVFRLLACFFMVILLAVLLITLCVIVYGQKILDFLRSRLLASWAVDTLFFILRYGRYLFTLFFLFIVFLIFYKWMPAGRRKLREQWRGALFATVSWLVFSWAFSFYVSLSNRYGIYGILGTVLVALLWMYYIMIFLLAGGYINNYFTSAERLKAKAADAGQGAGGESAVCSKGAAEGGKGAAEGGKGAADGGESAAGGDSTADGGESAAGGGSLAEIGRSGVGIEGPEAGK